MKQDYKKLLDEYIKEVSDKCKSMKNAGDEHTHRKALQELLESFRDSIGTTNEPPKNDIGRKLDIEVQYQNRVIGYIECKGTDKPLLSKGQNKLQKEEDISHNEVGRNYLYTNYLGFELYRDGECIGSTVLLEKDGSGVKMVSEYALQDTIELLTLFLEFEGIVPKRPQELAEMLAKYARMLSEGFYRRIDEAIHNKEEIDIMKDYKLIQSRFLEDMEYKAFTDLYAQTIVYGYIALYLHSKKHGKRLPSTFTFIKNLFKHIENVQEDDNKSFGAGYSALIKEIEWVLSQTDIDAMFREYEKGKNTKRGILYFYEDFLASFDKKSKKDKGVYYTPEPVVSFMVEAVDTILEQHFDIKDGLASEEKTATESEYKERVQVLDLATGTGTFLIKCLEVILERYGNDISQEKVKGIIERLNGFEISMASYTIAHLMMEYILSNKGLYDDTMKFSIALTNSLDNTSLDGQDDILLRDEAAKITAIKNRKPVMCIIGNPPYNAKSKNQGAYIKGLMEIYFKEPGTLEKLKERNSKNVNDDYCKFFRIAEHYISNNREGILCYITNSGYLSNTTFRGMRYHLLQTFETIYIVDLVGENVFDIKTPVCIFIGIKRKERKNTIADVYYTSVDGTREEVFKALRTSYKTLSYTKIDMVHPHYFFIPKRFDSNEYLEFDSLKDIFMIMNSGIKTSANGFLIHTNKKELGSRIQEYLKNYDSPEHLKHMYDISIERARMLVDKRSGLKYDEKKLMNIAYRPYDNRYVYYEREIIDGSRYEVMKHIVDKENISLLVDRGFKGGSFIHSFITKYISDHDISDSGAYNIPLYTYNNNDKQSNIQNEYRDTIADIVGYTPSSEDILYYIYGILHTPSYRIKYLEYLKIDYPRIPLPISKEHFDAVKEYGTELSMYHLTEAPSQSGILRVYPKTIQNDDREVSITKSSVYKDGIIYINKDFTIHDVPEDVWNVVIGGYQVAYKWLYNRNKTMLSYDEIEEYRKILIGLTAHVRIMKELDTVYNKYNR